MRGSTRRLAIGYSTGIRHRVDGAEIALASGAEAQLGIPVEVLEAGVHPVNAHPSLVELLLAAELIEIGNDPLELFRNAVSGAHSQALRPLVIGLRYRDAVGLIDGGSGFRAGCLELRYVCLVLSRTVVSARLVPCRGGSVFCPNGCFFGSGRGALLRCERRRRRQAQCARECEQTDRCYQPNPARHYDTLAADHASALNPSQHCVHYIAIPPCGRCRVGRSETLPALRNANNAPGEAIAPALL